MASIQAGKEIPPLQAPTAVFGGGNWLVTWQDANHHTVRGVRVDADANVLDATPFTIATDQTQTLGKVVASFDGVDYLVAWESGGIRLARVTTGGTVLDPGGVAGPAGTSPALAGRLLAYARPVNGTSRVLVRLRSFPQPSTDGGVDAHGYGDGGADGQVTDAGSDDGGGSPDAGVDSPSADGGSDGGMIVDASTVDGGGQTDASTADTSPDTHVADASADTSPADATTDVLPPDASADRSPADGEVDSSLDATSGDAVRDTGAEGPAEGSAGCGCALEGSRGPIPTWLGLVFSLLFVWLRRPRASLARRSRRISRTAPATRSSTSTSSEVGVTARSGPGAGRSKKSTSCSPHRC